jgi:hypothetical protein
MSEDADAALARALAAEFDQRPSHAAETSRAGAARAAAKVRLSHSRFIAGHKTPLAQSTLRINGKTSTQLADPKDELQPILELLTGKLTCGDCGKAVQRPQSKVRHRPRAQPLRLCDNAQASFNNGPGVDSKGAIMRLCHTTCKSCFTVICSGCGEESECPADCESEHSHGCATAQHCDKVRLVLLYEVRARSLPVNPLEVNAAHSVWPPSIGS